MTIGTVPLLLDEQNAAAYLRSVGWIDPSERVDVARLAGGVSNEVLYVQRADRPADEFVVKQVRHQLRTPQPWFSSIERIWREVDVLRACDEVLRREAPAGLRARTPHVIGQDRENYVFAMSAADRSHRVWKHDLLAGQLDLEIASQCGTLLGVLHAGTWADADVERRLGDRTLFDELRLDPYYRTLAAAWPAHRPHLERLIDSTLANARSLVHADFTPKNLLVWDGGLMMVDFETGHFGDPAFDLGLFLAHLVLKRVARPAAADRHRALERSFLTAYEAVVRPRIGDDEYRRLVERGNQHLAGCTWARLDGKSRIEYLDDEPSRQRVRDACLALFERKPKNWDDVLDRF